MNKIFIKTFGCSLNQADSETIQALLVNNGFKIVNNPEEAELVIINSCTVKGPTETNFFKTLRNYKEMNKPLIIAGCIAQATPEKVREYSLIGTTQIDKIVEVVEETLNGNIVHAIVREKKEKLALPKIRKNKVIEILPISEGCLGNCSYCITKLARGNLNSYCKDLIISRTKKALKEGVKEIWLTSQDLGAYGKDIGISLIDLLKDIIAIEGNFKVRLGMMNPEHLKGFIDELIQLYKETDKLFRFIHIPVQSGNDKILELMNRRYTVSEYKELIAKLRKELPDITIATDVIVGFPTETEDQFNDTVELIKEVKPDVCNISRFWPRPKTPASRMKQLPGWLTKRRSRLLTGIFHNIALINNEKWFKWRGKVLIDEIGKEAFIGRNYAYKPVVIKENIELGKEVEVEIKNVTPLYLLGRVIA